MDNAQRVDELGLGVRLSTYGFEDLELAGAVDRLVGDASLGSRLAQMSARIRSTFGTSRAAEFIERVALTGEPVTRG